MNRPVKAENLIPRLGVKFWYFEKKGKTWWGWTIEVFTLDTSGLPVIFYQLESHKRGTRSRLWLSMEKARNDPKDGAEVMAKEVGKRVKSTFEQTKALRGSGLVRPRGILE